MNNSASIQRHYMFRAAILLAFAVYIEHLARRDALHYYVTPGLAFWVRLCPVPLAFMALGLAVQAIFGRESAGCDCGHQLPAQRPAVSQFTALSCSPAARLRPAGQSAWQRRRSQQGSGANLCIGTERRCCKIPDLRSVRGGICRLGQEAVHPAGHTRVSANLLGNTGALDQYKQDFKGREVVVSGFLYRENNHDLGGRFAVSRFLVQCCTADATPLGVLVNAGQQKACQPTPGSRFGASFKLWSIKARKRCRLTPNR